MNTLRYSIFDCLTRERLSNKSYTTVDDANHDYFMNEGQTYVGIIAMTRRRWNMLPSDARYAALCAAFKPIFLGVHFANEIPDGRTARGYALQQTLSRMSFQPWATLPEQARKLLAAAR
jgi:hypothetical protein